MPNSIKKERAKIDIDDSGNITAYVSEYSEIQKIKYNELWDIVETETIFKGSQSNE